MVGAGDQVVAARGRHVSKARDHGLLDTQPGDFAVQQIRHQGIATGTVDSQHHGPDVGVDPKPFEHGAEPVEGDRRPITLSDPSGNEDIGHCRRGDDAAAGTFPGQDVSP